MLALLVALLPAQDMPLSEVLIPGEEWRPVSDGHTFTEGPAADAAGNLFFSDVPASKIWRVDAATGAVTPFAEDTGGANGLAFGPDGKLYACAGKAERIVRYDPGDGGAEPEVVSAGSFCNDLAVAADGTVYFTDPRRRRVMRVRDGLTEVVAEGFKPNGIVLWPDGGTLVVTDGGEPHLWAFRVDADGGLSAGEAWYGPVRTAPGEDAPGSDGMTVDADGRLYVATRAGVEFFDPEGRPSGVILKPCGAGRPHGSNVTFGGPDHRQLFYTVRDTVWVRRVRPRG